MVDHGIDFTFPEPVERYGRYVRPPNPRGLELWSIRKDQQHPKFSQPVHDTTFLPATCDICVWHERTAAPSTCTVQALLREERVRTAGTRDLERLKACRVNPMQVLEQHQDRIGTGQRLELSG
jgi:hypothetical protein